MNPKIILGLIEIARSIGRWVVEKLSYRAAQWVIHYMEGRVEVFQQRFARARTKHRQSWLRGRISRWMAAIVWLRSHVAALSKAAVRVYCKGTDKALRKIPLVAKCERYRRAA